MKRILFFLVTLSMFGDLVAQENNWNVYLKGQVVQSIDFEDEYVWAATDSFLVRLNKLENSITYYSYPYIDENGSFLNLKIDKNRVIWISRSEYLTGGQSIYDSYNSSIYCFDGDHWNYNKSLGNGLIYSLAIDKNNNKWIAGMNGLYKVEQDSCVKFTPENSGLQFNDVSQVTSDNDGNIWMLNYGNLGGLLNADFTLVKYDGNEWNLYALGRDTWLTTCIHFDGMGNTWVEKWASAQKLDTASHSWPERISLLTDGFERLYDLLAIEGENRFWFRNKVGEGITVYNGSDWSNYTTFNSGLPSDTVYQITIDSDGTKWIGTANGLVEINSTISIVQESKMKQEFEPYPNPATDHITIRLPEEFQNSTMDILNIQGKIIKSFSTNKNIKRVDVSDFSAGVYLVKIQSRENYSIKKFVKQ